MRLGWSFLLLGLAACAPIPLGSVPSYPYNLDDFPVFTAPSGQPIYGQKRYEERRWTASAPGPGTGFSFSITLELGLPPRPTSPFPDPVGSCRSRGTDEKPADAYVVLLAAPAGFGVALEKASYKLSCGRFERDARGFEVLRYSTWLEVLYRFELPPVEPGTYPLRWQLWDGPRLIAEEDRRFVLTAGR